MKFRRTVGGLAALATAGSAALMALAGPSYAGSVTAPSLLDPGPDHSAVSLLTGSSGQVTGLLPKASPLALPEQLLATLGSTTQIATAQLDRYVSAFGVKPADMRVTRSVEIGDGSATRYQQYLDGVRVFGGQLVASVDRQGRLQAILGHTARGALSPVSEPISELKGQLLAGSYVAKKSGVARSDLQTHFDGRRVYNPTLIGAPGPDANLDVNKYTVSNSTGTVRWTVLVSRSVGGVVLGFSQNDRLEREVCDRNNADGSLGGGDLVCDDKANKYVRSEGQGPSGIADVDEVYDNLGKVAQTYAAYVNLDVTSFIGSDDGDGKALRATTRVCASDVQPDCPMANAFWTGGKQGQMVYGDGYTKLDVTGHELSHGVTEHTSGLFNVYQSGALNESNSDVWGEIIDLFNNPDKPAADRWMLGDEMPGGALRNMADPTKSQNPQPDRMTSDLWGSGPDDQGFVHQNDGVGNKTAYLIAAGGSFNGYDVRALGLAKTAKIYWTVNNLLTSGADYKDLFHALPIACEKNIGRAGTYITADDCAQVDSAIRATELYKDPPGGAPVNTPYCDGGAKVNASYTEGFDGTTDWIGHGGAGLASDVGFPYVNTGKDSYVLFTQGTDSTSAEVASDPVDVKAGELLRVDLATFFDLDAPNTSDDISAKLEYSVDGGARKPASDLAVANGGPWTGHSGGWSSAKYDLSSLAGKSVQFFFSVDGVSSAPGTPASTLSLDNFKVYTCG